MIIKKKGRVVDGRDFEIGIIGVLHADLMFLHMKPYNTNQRNVSQIKSSKYCHFHDFGARLENDKTFCLFHRQTQNIQHV